MEATLNRRNCEEDYQYFGRFALVNFIYTVFPCREDFQTKSFALYLYHYNLQIFDHFQSNYHNSARNLVNE